MINVVKSNSESNINVLIDMCEMETGVAPTEKEAKELWTKLHNESENRGGFKTKEEANWAASKIFAEFALSKQPNLD